jgi:STE24 endopeptidase
MYGFGKNKRIVLFDTLLEEYTPVERTPKNDTEGDDSSKADDNSNEDDEKVRFVQLIK